MSVGRAEVTGTSRRSIHSVRYLGAAQCRFIHSHHVAAIDSLSVGKRGVRSHRDGTRIVRVSVVVVVDGCAIDVAVADVGVMDVDAVPVSAAAAIPRPVRLSPT